MGPRRWGANLWATKIAVGPSMAPMTPTLLASRGVNPRARARLSAAKIPSCPAAAKTRSMGLRMRLEKSLIAPIPMKRKAGRSSFSIP
jgi:hypothetical protein